MQDLADKCNAEMLEAVRDFRKLIDNISLEFINSAVQASKEMSAKVFAIQLEFEADSQRVLSIFRGEIKVEPQSHPDPNKEETKREEEPIEIEVDKITSSLPSDVERLEENKILSTESIISDAERLETVKREYKADE